jgi:hypothetical protein
MWQMSTHVGKVLTIKVQGLAGSAGAKPWARNGKKGPMDSSGRQIVEGSEERRSQRKRERERERGTEGLSAHGKMQTYIPVGGKIRIIYSTEIATHKANLIARAWLEEMPGSAPHLRC